MRYRLEEDQEVHSQVPRAGSLMAREEVDNGSRADYRSQGENETNVLRPATASVRKYFRCDCTPDQARRRNAHDWVVVGSEEEDGSRVDLDQAGLVYDRRLHMAREEGAT